MDEERFNLELRKFLKRFGITAQREIEKGVLAALEAHAVADDAVLPVYATLTTAQSRMRRPVGSMSSLNQ